MKIVIEIPKEFEEHFNNDRFYDSLARIAHDIEIFGSVLSGRYEIETLEMLKDALKKSEVLSNEKIKPKKARWIMDVETRRLYFCSNCHCSSYYKTSECLICHSEME